MRYFYEVDPKYGGNLRSLASFLLCQPFRQLYFSRQCTGFNSLGIDSLGGYCQRDFEAICHMVAQRH